MKTKTILSDNLQKLKRMGRFSSNASLARRIGVASRTINLLFTEHEGNPTLSTIELIADTLKQPAWTLIFAGYPFESRYEKKINRLISVLLELDEKSLDRIIEQAEDKKSLNEVREELKKYEHNAK